MNFDSFVKLPSRARVEVYAADGDILRTVAVVTWADDRVDISGDSSFVAELRSGLASPALERVVTPDDGFAFLLAVVGAYDHQALMTSGILEGDDGKP
jgi:hypothetical protein